MQEIAQVDSRVERMMQLESLFMRDPDLLREYLKDLRDRLDYENSFKWARTDGLEQGRAEGEARGRADTARNLLRMGLAPSQIAEAGSASLVFNIAFNRRSLTTEECKKWIDEGKLETKLNVAACEEENNTPINSTESPSEYK